MTEYRDRRTGLLIFGILHILLGALCVILMLGVAAASEIQTRRGGPPVPMLAQTLLVYAVFTFYFVTIGIGSIRARRWARAVALAVSSIWAILGVGSIASLFFTIPRMLVLIPPSRTTAVVTIMVSTSVILYFLVPMAFVLFYRSPHVRATCEARDPKPRWTDRAPVPVLAVSIILAFTAIVLVATLAHPAVPLPGTILTGASAMVVILGIAGLFAFLSVQFFRLKRSAWWTLVLLQVAAAIVWTLTLRTFDVNAWYQATGVPVTPQVQVMHLERLFHSAAFQAVTIAVWIAYLALLVWMRRYFTGAVPRTRAGDQIIAT